MRASYLVIAFLNILTLNAQKKYYLIDDQYDVPIEFAYITIGKTTLVSDLEGGFILIDNVLEDTVTIHHISYNEKKVAIKDLPSYCVNGNKLMLKSKIIPLNEVVVKYRKNRFKRIGCSSNSKKFWDEIKRSGVQLATKINWPKSKDNCKLIEMNFNIAGFSGDSILVAVKFFKLKKDSLGESICNFLIPKMIRSNDKIINVDLRPYNINIEEDFAVGIKCLRCYGKDAYLRIPVGIDLLNGKVFATYPSRNGQFTRIKKRGSYGFNLLVEY